MALCVLVTGENWLEAITQDLSPMHILTPLSVTLNVYKCIVTDTNLPKYDSQFSIKRLLQFQFDCDSTRQRKWPSGHHDSMLMKAWIHTRRHFASGVGDRAIYQRRQSKDATQCWFVSVNAIPITETYMHYYIIICPVHCLLIGYDTSRCDEKMNMFIFRRSRIEAESKSNHNNSRLSHQTHSALALLSGRPVRHHWLKAKTKC